LYFETDFHLYTFAEGRNENFDQFSIAKAKAGYAVSFLEKFSTQFTTEAGFKIGNDATRSLDFFIGGYGFAPLNNIVPLLGYEALQLRGDSYILSSLTIDYELFRKNHLNLFANIANVEDNLFETGEWLRKVDYTGFGVGYGLETILGPIEVKYAYSPEQKEGEWYVSAGFRF
jgi:NTE family protein